VNWKTAANSVAGTYARHGSRKQVNSAGRKAKLYQPIGSRELENMILVALPPAEHSYLHPFLEFTTLKFGDVLWEPSQPIESAYFPSNGVVSFVAVMRDGASVEVAMTGREGFVGTPLILGARDVPVRAVVQIEGEGFRIESDLLRQILPRTPLLEQMLRRYAHAHAMQVAQVGACNRLHQVSERLARWLAMSNQRTESELLPVTQEFLAQMLGCRRSSVTAALGSLQSAGAIRCARGHVGIVNRKILERRACECYGVMRRIFYPARIN
jgi:CRP-like cAMP-binding protein